jgi:hypothetical protein
MNTLTESFGGLFLGLYTKYRVLDGYLIDDWDPPQGSALRCGGGNSPVVLVEIWPYKP